MAKKISTKQKKQRAKFSKAAKVCKKKDNYRSCMKEKLKK